jgi:signal transduction histidine kinase
MVKDISRVLVVDDEEIVRFVFRETLTEKGFFVIEAKDGGEALARFASGGIDAVLLDLKMPGMDGIETMKRLKELDPDVPVIMVTAFGDIATAVEAIKMGAYDFVEKPPQISRIMVTLERAIEKSLLERRVKKLGKSVEETETLRAVCEKLKEMDRLKTVFLSSFSHELKTPLTSIVGYARLVDKKLGKVLAAAGRDDGQSARELDLAKKNAGIIITEAEKLTGLINNILDITEMESGSTQWRRERLSLALHIGEAAVPVAEICRKKGLKFIMDVEEGLPEVMGDRSRLLRVMNNLFSNAVKFTEKGAVTVTARLVSCPAVSGESGGTSIMVSVGDTGQGITGKDMESIFEIFCQTGDGLTDKPGGIGLGLPLCRQIIERHGGRIWAESEYGNGSVFTFTLPVEGGKDK